MSSPTPSLDELRREIDEIDDKIHDLIMRRAQVVELVGIAKRPDNQIVRPGREATILRRLAARHTGPFPMQVLARLWREMIATFSRIQGPFAIAVYAPEDRRGFWDISRDHYGSSVPMTAVNTPAAAIRAVADGTATVGVVPMPEEDDHDPWWRYLMNQDPKTPRVVASLPFCGRGNARGDDRDALAIALIQHERTGDDRTLLGIELTEDRSRGRLKEALEAAGLATVSFRSWTGRESGGGPLHLVEVADYVDLQDKRLSAFAANMGDILLRTTPIGGYAVPLGSSSDPKKL
ncbi:chorismate mutase [Skermanella sp. TT6]|mgnify:CR=1 FL=1|uniref:chorismate mutase n=2 Tax=Skermanella cutis TaxID=2775420 RepID=A0ABX7BBV5_9PROT|nr:chorismate mutase [Skermanella sp. TT6]QQP91598.1 chorismate mutase [Skermanella sp. TT6]